MKFNPPYSIISLSSLACHFHPEHLADLRASGLSDDTIRAAGVYSIAPNLISHFFGRSGAPEEVTSALCFPYQGGDFARIKLFPPLNKMKYSQPPNTSARLYVPFPIQSGAVYVCEGEKKTLAAHQAGLNAVGIGGVWSWLSKGTPIDDLSLIDWNDRDVIIIPDSDVFQRIDLLHAIYALGREVKDAGAAVTVARLPHDGTKLGLDDYLVAGGRIEALDTFNLSRSIFSSCRAWYGKWKLNKALNQNLSAAA